MMLPSHFLNVVLEEIEGDVNTAKTDIPEPSFSSLKALINSPLRQQLSIPVPNLVKPKNTNNNNLFVGLEFPKRLPEAFLSECIVEPCKGAARKPLPEPRFEVLLLPIYKNAGNNGKSTSTPSDRDEDVDSMDESIIEVDALPEVEAVYSEHGSDSDQEIILEDPPPKNMFDSLNKSDCGGTPLKIHMCKFCHKIFPNKGVLWTHTNIAHSDQINCECPICGRVFHRNCNLAVHLKSHEAEGAVVPETKGPESLKSSANIIAPDTPLDRPFKCPYCPKSYSQRSVLKKHMVVHTGERLTCNLCGIDFTQKSSLLRHTKRIHSGERNLSFTRTPRKVPPLVNLRLTDQLKKMLAAASIPRKLPSSLSQAPNDVQRVPQSDSLDLSQSKNFCSVPQPADAIPSSHPTENSDDQSSSSKHSTNSEETEHSVDMPEQMATFIQSLKIPQGISISMIDD